MPWFSVAAAPPPTWATAEMDEVTLWVVWEEGSAAVEFVATSTDTDPDGADLWARAIAGEFGEIAAYEPGSADGTISWVDIMNTGESQTIPAFGIVGEPIALAYGQTGRDLLEKEAPDLARTVLEVPHAGPAPGLTDLGYAADFNQDIPSGWYTVSGVFANGPAGTGTYTGVLFVIRRSYASAHEYQVLIIGSSMWMRYGANVVGASSWSTWVKLVGLSDANTWSALQDMRAGLKVGGGSTLAKILTATASLDFPSIAAGSYQDLTITVAGAQINDSVALGLPSTVTAGLIFTAFVSAANTVKVRAANTTAAAIDPGAATVRATVFSF